MLQIWSFFLADEMVFCTSIIAEALIDSDGPQVRVCSTTKIWKDAATHEKAHASWSQ